MKQVFAFISTRLSRSLAEFGVALGPLRLFGARALPVLLLASALGHATPPPNAVEEGFGVASATGDATPAAEPETQPASAEDKGKLSVAQRLDALLAENPHENDERTSVRCINRRQIDRIEILSSSLLLIHGRRDKYWINQFPHKCVGLRRNMALVMEVRTAQICALDNLYGNDRFDSIGQLGFGGRGSASAHCVFAPFEEISPEQAEAVRIAAKNGEFR